MANILILLDESIPNQFYFLFHPIFEIGQIGYFLAPLTIRPRHEATAKQHAAHDCKYVDVLALSFFHNNNFNTLHKP